MTRQLYRRGDHECRNLAGRSYADAVIRSELNRASIPIVKCDNDGEVPSTIGGRLDDFTFVRGWRYWRVKGFMPYAMACYINRRRGGEVRTVGFAGGIHQSSTARTGSRPTASRFGQPIKKLRMSTLSRDTRTGPPSLSSSPTRRGYHVDTVEGLRFLAKTIRRLRGKQ